VSRFEDSGGRSQTLGETLGEIDQEELVDEVPERKTGIHEPWFDCAVVGWGQRICYGPVVLLGSVRLTIGTHCVW
jgi:hypothetical protein